MELDAVVGVAGGETASRQDAVAALFREHAVSLVRLARLFVDDRNAAEDLVQEAFIRLDRSLHRIAQPERAAAYLRTIVLNLARDHNRRGLVSLRHRLPEDRQRWSPVEDDLIVREDQREVLEALRRLPKRQRDCLVLHYFMELTVPAIAETLGLSVNSVKTHLRRARAALTTQLEGHT